MIHAINIALECYYDGESMVINYPFNVSENLQDIIEYLYEEEYHSKYYSHSWFLESGSREFVENLKKLWGTNSFDTFSLYTKDYNFIKWLADRYYSDALLQYTNENIMINEENKELDKDILDLYE